MSQKAARLLLLLSVLLLSIVALDFTAFRQNQEKEKEKIAAKRDEAKSQVLGEVLPGSSSYYYKFYLKDASATNITGSYTPTNYLEGATAVVVNKSSFSCGGTHTFEDYDGLYKLICTQASTMQVQISKAGYQTKTINLAYYQGDIPTVLLYKAVPKPPAPPPETIKNISIPSVFKEKGSATTDLSKVSDPAKVANLTLDTKVNTIKFKSTVNLSSTDTKNKFKKLDQYVKADKKGKIGLDSKSLPVLNKPATLTMKELSFTKVPKIYVDGKEDKSVVSNIKFEKGTLTFDVSHFSTFTVVPEIEITEPKNNLESKNAKLTLKGSVSDKLASLSAKLNDQDLGEIKVSTQSGEFSKPITLKEGVNKIIVTALSANGATNSASVSATFVVGSLSKLGPIWFVLAFFALIALALLIFSLKHLRPKKAIVQTPSESKPATSN